MRSGHCLSVFFVAIATLLAAGHAAAQGIDKPDWNPTQALGVAEQASNYDPVVLPVNNMEAEQSFRGSEFEPISAEPIVLKAATADTIPTPSRAAPALDSPSPIPGRPTPVFATGKPRVINRFGEFGED